ALIELHEDLVPRVHEPSLRQYRLNGSNLIYQPTSRLTRGFADHKVAPGAESIAAARLKRGKKHVCRTVCFRGIGREKPMMEIASHCAGGTMTSSSRRPETPWIEQEGRTRSARARGRRRRIPRGPR